MFSAITSSNIVPTHSVLYLLTFSATSILAQKDKGERAKLITDFIYIADELYKLNNFSSTSVNFMPAGIR